MEFTATERGQRKLIKDGYLYILQKNLANDFTSWECVLRRRGHCKARVKLDLNDNFVEQTNQHTHPPGQTNREVAKVRTGIKRRATETLMTNQQILAEQLGAISEGAATNLPVVENLRRNIPSARQEKNLPPLPIKIAAIPVLLIEFQTTTAGNSFCFSTAVLVLLTESLICISSRKTAACSIGKLVREMVLLRSAQRYSTSCTLFTCNAMVESFCASLLSYPIKLKLLTEGL